MQRGARVEAAGERNADLLAGREIFKNRGHDENRSISWKGEFRGIQEYRLCPIMRQVSRAAPAGPKWGREGGGRGCGVD
ncbi:hypothetical protein GRT45_10830, partial [Burkholderia pseudomallei]|nr:hypothetical protein [Burkholderia pseudomallei]MXQ38139.1 hypothetical protein [Burkholderia pseudomallei]